jgi:pSer/pThr/pTyr-binding forkhead associated (FHA) protein
MPDIWLRVREGPDAGHEWHAAEELVVGRAGDADVILADPTVSRRHACVSPEGETAVVEDLGSSNGTFVNGERVGDPSRAAEGDEIQVGDSVLEVRIGPTETQTLPGDTTEVRPPPDSSQTRS